MRRIGTLAGALAIALAATASAASVDDLIREFSGDADPVKRTPAQLEAAYAKVLAALIPDMGKERIPDRAKSQQTFERISLRAGRPGAGAERLALSKAMAARLGPATPKQARIWLVKQLQHIGRDEAAPAVAKLLGDQDPLIRERARRALQDNPSPAVPAALRNAPAQRAVRRPPSPYSRGGPQHCGPMKAETGSGAPPKARSGVRSPTATDIR